MKRFFFLTLIFFAALSFQSERAIASSVNVNLNVAVCNLNNICEAVIGETTASCPLDCPAPTSTPSSGGRSSVEESPAASSIPSNSIIGSIHIAPFQNHAVFQFESNLPSLMTFTWGKTAEYEVGSLADSWYHSKFDLTLENLKPYTRYYYRITLKDTLGKTIIREGDFLTLPIPDLVAPDPVLNFSYALAPNNNIIFRWSNPTAKDFALVRIVRSDLFYPKDPLSGKVIYEGSGEYARDSSAEAGKAYYYSAFARDLSGNISSPSILRVSIPLSSNNAGKNPPKDYLLNDDTPYDFTSNRIPFDISADGLSSLSRGTFCILPNQLLNGDLNKEGRTRGFDSTTINLSTVRFSQQEASLSHSENNVTVGEGIPIQVEIPRNKTSFTEDSSLAFCLKGASVNERLGFLFDVDHEKNVFKITIPPFALSGDYQFYVGMLNTDGRETALVKGVFNVHPGDVSQSKSFADQIARFINAVYEAIVANSVAIAVIFAVVAISLIVFYLYSKIS